MKCTLPEMNIWLQIAFATWTLSCGCLLFSLLVCSQNLQSMCVQYVGKFGEYVSVISHIVLQGLNLAS